jgi:hypothetical protein
MKISELTARTGRVFAGMPKNLTDGVKTLGTTIKKKTLAAGTKVKQAGVAAGTKVKTAVQKQNKELSDRAERRVFQKADANKTDANKTDGHEKVTEHYEAEHTRLSSRTGTVNALIDLSKKITSRHVMGKGNRDNLIKLLEKINDHDGNADTPKIQVSRKVKAFLDTIKNDVDAGKTNFNTVAVNKTQGLDVNNLNEESKVSVSEENASKTRFQNIRDSKTVAFASKAAEASKNITGGVAGSVINDRNIVGASINGVLKTSAAVTGGTLGLLLGAAADTALGVKQVWDNRKKAGTETQTTATPVISNTSHQQHQSSGSSVSSGSATIGSDAATVVTSNVTPPTPETPAILLLTEKSYEDMQNDQAKQQSKEIEIEIEKNKILIPDETGVVTIMNSPKVEEPEQKTQKTINNNLSTATINNNLSTAIIKSLLMFMLVIPMIR